MVFYQTGYYTKRTLFQYVTVRCKRNVYAKRCLHTRICSLTSKQTFKVGAESSVHASMLSLQALKTEKARTIHLNAPGNPSHTPA